MDKSEEDRRPVLMAIVNGQRLEELEEDKVSLKLVADAAGLVCQASIGDASPCQVCSRRS